MGDLSSFFAVARTEMFINMSRPRCCEFCIFLQDVYSLMLEKFQKLFTHNPMYVYSMFYHE